MFSVENNLKVQVIIYSEVCHIQHIFTFSKLVKQLIANLRSLLGRKYSILLGNLEFPTILHLKTRFYKVNEGK